MPEYIDREAAVMKIREWFWSAPGVHPKLDRDTAEEILFAIPAADVVPVRHGRWIEDDISGIVRCSLCDNDAPGDTTGGGQYKSPYCQSCGALMDKDGDGDV